MFKLLTLLAMAPILWLNVAAETANRPLLLANYYCWYQDGEHAKKPLLHWTPSIAACGLTCYTGDKFPKWKYDFFAGGLRGELHRIRVQKEKVVADEILLSGLGRIRDVRTGPDGFLHILLNQPDRIVRLVPAE